MASELLRALRGSKRSRPGFSRHLGYQSNIAQRWETGLAWPTAATFLSICERLRIDVQAALARFLRREPEWLEQSVPELGAALLRELRGRTPLVNIVEQTPYHRSSISRWLEGTARPKLPEFLCLIDALSGRCLDFIAAFVDPRVMPSVARRWDELELSRELAYAHPMSHAVLRALELEEYKQGGYRDPSFLTRTLSIPSEDAERALALLVQSGQLRKTRYGFRMGRASVVDTGSDVQRARALKLTWAEFAVQRLRAGAPGQCGYSLFSISRADLRRLHEIQLTFVREMQAVISASTKSECVGLYCSQLLDLGLAEQNALSGRTAPR
jgi:hypothetical protein